MDPIIEQKNAKESDNCKAHYTLPDGNSISINAPRFLAPEALFNPDLIKEGDNVLGLHQMTYGAIQDCDLDFRKDIQANVILCGGSSLFKGLSQRLEKEIEKMCPGYINLVEIPDKQYSVWKGGSTLTSLSTFDNMWISSGEYEEEGSDIVNRKCV